MADEVMGEAGRHENALGVAGHASGARITG
jgi:hypothetical protein